MAPLPSQPNQSILEGIEVLLEVARRRQPVRVRALARDLGMTPTRLQRFLGTLAHAGMLRQLPDRTYTIGSGMHALSVISLSASGLELKARKILPGLRDLGGIIALGVLWRDMVSYPYFENEKGRGRTSDFTPVEDYPVRDSVVGEIILAHMDEDEVKSGWPDIWQNQPQTLRDTRKRGYAVKNRGEDTWAFAVPVGDPPYAGLAFQGRCERSRELEIVGRLKKAARDLNEENL